MSYSQQERAIIDRIVSERDDLRTKLDASERACAKMRQCLEHFREQREAIQLGVPHEVLDAMSSDAGRDYVPKAEVEEAWRKGMTDAAEICQKAFTECATYNLLYAEAAILSARDAMKQRKEGDD